MKVERGHTPYPLSTCAGRGYAHIVKKIVILWSERIYVKFSNTPSSLLALIIVLTLRAFVHMHSVASGTLSVGVCTCGIIAFQSMHKLKL